MTCIVICSSSPGVYVTAVKKKFGLGLTCDEVAKAAKKLVSKLGKFYVEKNPAPECGLSYTTICSE